MRLPFTNVIKNWSGCHRQHMKLVPSQREAGKTTFLLEVYSALIIILQDTGKTFEGTEISSLNIFHQLLQYCESEFSAIKLFGLALVLI